jgi:serine/threonine-protein kinase
LELSVYTCPGCGFTATAEALAGAQYRCGQCGLEVAHVETTALGLPRRVIQWLRHPGELVLDRYRIVRVLGKGGFAATYLVEDLRVNGKKRALKEIPESLYDVTETELLSRLNHPSIPDITDQDRRDGMVYLVLELGGGRTLEAERKLAGGKVPLGRALSWLQQLGAVLAYLHAQTPPIIHRDLKPENVLLDEIGRIMLIDFGIAKQAADGAQTRALARAATHGYSPPEQAMGTGTDPRSDVYALAATFYALVTGTVPTPAHERVAGTDLADPATLVPELPASMAGALLQALSLNINRRPASIEAFLHAMGLMATPAEEAAATSRTVLVGDLGSGRETGAASVRIRSERLTVTPVAPPARRRSGAVIWTAVGVLALAAGAGGLWFLQQQEAPAPTVAQPATPPPAPEATGARPPAIATGVQPPGPVPGLPPAQQAAPRVPDAQVAPAGLAAGAGSPTADAATPPLPAALPEPPAPPTPDVAETATTTAVAVPIAAATAPVTLSPPEPPASLPPRPRLEPAPEAASSSAMDAFEKRRTRPATEQPEVVVSAPPDADRPAPVQQKPKPKPKAPAQPEGNSGWSGVYIGGSRRE